MKTNLLLSVLLNSCLIYIVTSARPRIIEGEFALPVASTTDLSNKTSGIYRAVQKISIPSSYGYEEGEIYDDIAILRLKHPLPLGDHETLGAVQLPNVDEYLPPGKFDGSIAGFGTNSQILNTITGELESNPPVPYLKYARGVINAPNESYQCDSGEICFEPYGLSNGHLEGPCQGDSGGPLVIHGSNILVGIDSYSRNVTCGIRNTFTRVSEYLDFIKMVLDGNIDETVVPVELTLDAEDHHPNIPLCEF
ncbi:hypothetical protein TKK_0010703 [Trichogramma kaykai]